MRPTGWDATGSGCRRSNVPATPIYKLVTNPRAAVVAVFFLCSMEISGRPPWPAAGSSAQRLLAAEPECAAHGYLSWDAMLIALRTDDPEKCPAALSTSLA